MKKIVAVVLVCMMMFLTACGHDRSMNLPAKKQGEAPVTKMVKQYGVIDIFTNKDIPDPRVEYKLIVGNCVAAAVFSATIIVPVIVIGWYMFEPVAMNPDFHPEK